MSEALIAAIQMNSGADVAANLAAAGRLLADARAQGAQLAVLPENFALMGVRETDKLAVAESEGHGAIQDFLAETAQRLGLWLVGGTVPLKTREPSRVAAACLVFDPRGARGARYDKIHLFDVEIPESGGEAYRESASIAPGEIRAVTLDTPLGRLGLSVCYDLRFPELYRALALAGAEILTVPANFTERTGRDHWEVLLRARAIENGAFVLAPAQIGGPPGQPAFGRSMIIDPWGTVIAQAPDTVGIIRANIETDRVAAVRRQIPVLANRRLAAYG